MTTILEDMVTRVDTDMKEGINKTCRAKEGEEIIRNLILPHMPKTLDEYLKLTYVSFGYSGPRPTQIRMDFCPIKEDYPADLVLGTLTKVADGLSKGGWTIADGGPKPEAVGKELWIVISGMRKLDAPKPSLYSRIVRKEKQEKPRHIELLINFEKLQSTEHCRIMDKEVSVEAVPKHKVTRSVLVCDEEGWDKDGQ